MKLGNKDIGAGHPCCVVAEVGMGHDGSISIAHAMIDVAARAGADAVKFQTHIAAAESTPLELFRKPGSLPDATRHDYWLRTEFTTEEWSGLAAHTRSAGLEFLSSPFSVEAAHMLASIGMPAWKIASGEIGNEPLLDYVGSTGQPVILSTGLSTIDETESLVRRFQGKGCPSVVLHCTTEYPCRPESINLGIMDVYRRRLGCPIGFSDHSGQTYAGLAAVAAYAADVVEVHVVLCSEMPGPDTRASLTPQQLSDMIEGVRFIEAALQGAQSKDVLTDEQRVLRAMFGRSVVAAHPLSEGSVLGLADLAAKKPAGGLPADKMGELVGRRLKRSLGQDEIVLMDDVE